MRCVVLVFVASALPACADAEGSSVADGSGREVPERALRAIDVDVSTQAACALDERGSAWCWGNTLWRPSDSLGREAQRVEGSEGLQELFVQEYFACGTDDSQRLWCWSEMPNFPSERSPDAGVHPLRVPAPPERSVHVAAGSDHLCAVDADAALWCWGQNLDGQIAHDEIRTYTPYRLEHPANVTSVSAGYSKTCAVTAAGEAWCWGLVDDLLEAPDFRSWVPLRVEFVSDLVEISSRYDGACGLHSDETVSCWGRWVPETFASDVPLKWYRVPDLENVVRVSAGAGHACALRADETAWCWGHNDHGQLGDGTREDRDHPVQVRGLGNVREVVAGNGVTVALDTEGVVWAWGNFLSHIVPAAGGAEVGPTPVLRL